MSSAVWPRVAAGAAGRCPDPRPRELALSCLAYVGWRAGESALGWRSIRRCAGPGLPRLSTQSSGGVEGGTGDPATIATLPRGPRNAA